MKQETIAAFNINSDSASFMHSALELIESKFAAAVNGSLAITRLGCTAIAAPLMDVLDQVAERIAESKTAIDAERIRWAFEREATSNRAEFKLAFAVEATLYLYWEWKAEIKTSKSGTQNIRLVPSARVEIGSSGTSRTPEAALALADLLREAATIGTRVSMMAADFYLSATLPAAVAE